MLFLTKKKVLTPYALKYLIYLSYKLYFIYKEANYRINLSIIILTLNTILKSTKYPKNIFKTN